jgi:hypothetical protein
MTSDLYQFSINQLAVNKGRWPEIARDCDVSYSWLCKFANNEIPNASYAKVKRIAERLLADAKKDKGRRKQDRNIH